MEGSSMVEKEERAVPSELWTCWRKEGRAILITLF